MIYQRVLECVCVYVCVLMSFFPLTEDISLRAPPLRSNPFPQLCDGRVVSVLEGGYDVLNSSDGLATCTAAHVLALANRRLSSLGRTRRSSI